jgi:hypothetical protein
MAIEDICFEMAEDQDDENLKLVLNTAGTVIQNLRQKLEEAQDRLKKLDALEAGGVDNWVWYDDAMSSITDKDEED